MDNIFQEISNKPSYVRGGWMGLLQNVLAPKVGWLVINMILSVRTLWMTSILKFYGPQDNITSKY